jgi:hypothetical protein
MLSDYASGPPGCGNFTDGNFFKDYIGKCINLKNSMKVSVFHLQYTSAGQYAVSKVTGHLLETEFRS